MLIKEAVLVKIIILFISVQSFAYGQSTLENFFRIYKKGNYQKAIEVLETIKGNKGFDNRRTYLKALCYKKLQRFDKANTFFKLALKKNIQEEEFFYEYAQSLYGASELEKAYKAFSLSIKNNFKVDSSIYYMAYIAEILENHKSTHKNYIKLMKDKNTEVGLRQVAYFKMAELIYNLIKKRFDKITYVKKYILPLFKKGISLAPLTEAARDMELRLDQIMLEYNIHPLMMANGRMLTKDGFNLYFSHKISKDNNVSLANDQASVSTVLKPSIINETSIYTSYRAIIGKRLVAIPEIRLTYIKHRDQKNKDVFKNDSLSFAPALKTTFEHKLWNRQASFLFDLDFNRTKRDYNAVHKLEQLGDTFTYVFGEKIKYFKAGDTTLKVKFKSYKNYDPNFNFDTTSFSLDQIWITKKGHIAIGLFLLDMNSNADESLSTNSYLFRHDYLIPELFGSLWGASGNLSLTLLDTLKQKAERGIEKTYGIGVGLDRKFGKHWQLNLFYDYTKNTSLNAKVYTYTKSIFGAELRWSL